MWLIIAALVLLASGGGFVYLTAGFHRFGFMRELDKKSKIASWVLSAAAIALIGGIWGLINIWSVMIVLIHLFFFWLGADAVSAFIARCRKKKPKRNYAGASALFITTIYLAIGWFLAHAVVQTDYGLRTDKNIGKDGMRIALIADSHIGITLDGGEFAREMKRINADEPDMVIVAGDFVDDDSRRRDMVEACAALGSIKTKYGVFYSLGNHDEGYFDGGRDFTIDDVISELEKNGVTVLMDEAVMVDENICVIGRKDRSEEISGGRKTMAELTAGMSPESYKIVIDHQPNDYAAEAAGGADLVLSGHTHGGHIFPAGYIGVLIGANDRAYGTERRDATDFVVTSGISGWAIPFKTGCKSEYVIIDVEEN